MISLKEIGNICGMAESTVSKALKDNPKIKLSTRRLIQEVAKEHGYHPNAMVECLQTGKSKTIGIAHNKFDDMFAGAVMQGIHESLFKEGYDSIIINWDLIVEEGEDILSKFSRRRVDGLLIFPMEKLPSDYYLEQLRGFHNPIVIIDQTWENNEFNYIGSGNYQSAYMATDYMIKQGLTRLGNIHYSKVSSGRERLAGFLDALSANSLPVTKDWLVDVNDCLDAPYDKIVEFIGGIGRPEGIACFNDNVALELLAAAADLGIRVPDELSVFGFGDLPFASAVRPALTTVAQSPAEIGVKAVEVLMNKIAGTDQDIRSETVPGELIIRRSVLSKKPISSK